MPARPSSAGKKGGKKGGSAAGKKGKKKSSKAGAIDPHQEQLDGLIREREEIRSKLNVICSKIIENINMDDFQNEIDLSKQQPSDISIENLSAMIDQICYYRVAFLNIFQESDDDQRVSVHRKVTQLSIDEPDMFRKRLTADQRLTFVTRERDVWKENAQLLQIMYASVVDQLEMGVFKKVNGKNEDILQNHRLNLEDVCLIFSSPRIRSINDAQKLRAKKTLDNVLNDLRDQHAFFDLDQPQKQQDMTDGPKTSSSETPFKSHSSSRLSASERRNHQSVAARRSVSFADEVNVLNDDDEQIDLNQQRTRLTSAAIMTHEQFNEDNISSSPFLNSSSLIISNEAPLEEKFVDSDYYSLSSSSSHPQQQQHHETPSQSKYNLPVKYRLPLAREVLVNKMDSNLRMLIIKELSKSGHTERPLSRMSSSYGTANSSDSASRRRHKSRSSSMNESPEWVEFARLIGIDQSEIEHWLSQNLQYPAGRVISAWCNYASPPPTVAELHSLVSSNELNRPDLARYIETMYITES